MRWQGKTKLASEPSGRVRLTQERARMMVWRGEGSDGFIVYLGADLPKATVKTGAGTTAKHPVP